MAKVLDEDEEVEPNLFASDGIPEIFCVVGIFVFKTCASAIHLPSAVVIVPSFTCDPVDVDDFVVAIAVVVGNVDIARRRMLPPRTVIVRGEKFCQQQL